MLQASFNDSLSQKRPRNKYPQEKLTPNSTWKAVAPVGMARKVMLPAGYCLYYARGSATPLLQLDYRHANSDTACRLKRLGVVEPSSSAHSVVEEEYAIIREVSNGTKMVDMNMDQCKSSGLLRYCRRLLETEYDVPHTVVHRSSVDTSPRRPSQRPSSGRAQCFGFIQDAPLLRPGLLDSQVRGKESFSRNIAEAVPRNVKSDAEAPCRDTPLWQTDRTTVTKKLEQQKKLHLSPFELNSETAPANSQLFQSTESQYEGGGHSRVIKMPCKMILNVVLPREDGILCS